jgi:hypothetical protein
VDGALPRRIVTAGRPFLVDGLGQEGGFNGTLIRFRIYAFDGKTFRTIWTPDDMLDAEIALRDDGFEIKHLLKKSLPWRFVRDDYRLVAQGPVRVARRQVD